MSRFKPSAAALTAPYSTPTPARVPESNGSTVPTIKPPALVFNQPYSWNLSRNSLDLNQIQTDPNGIAVRWGFVILCLYLVSNLVNDWSVRIFHTQAYLSLVTGAALPLLFLASMKNMLTPLRTKPGMAWVLLIVWMVLCIPFSSWPGGSLRVVASFGTKNYPLLLYIVAFTVTFSQLRKLFHLQALSGVLVLASCFAFGENVDGRFQITDSLFYDNPNDLALQLIVSASALVYWLYSRNALAKVIGLMCVALCMVFLLKTGSRSNFIAAVACVLVAGVLIRQKIQFWSAAIILGLVGLIVVPTDTLGRLVNIVWNPTDEEISSSGDIGSQAQRTEMLQQSLEYTAKNPIFGIGPGQFPELMWSSARDRGEFVIYLQTHNAYTQISSENGIPGLLFYVITLFGSMWMALRAYRRCLAYPELTELSSMAFSALLMLLAYAIGSFFNHVGYGRHLPVLAGLAIAVWNMTEQAIAAKDAQPAFRLQTARV